GVEQRAVIAAFVLHDDPELLAAGCEILPPELPACAEKGDIGERRRQPLELSPQEVVIEADVVASEHMSMPQQSDHVSGDRGKRRGVDHVAGRDAVDARRSDVSPGIHQALVLVTDVAVWGQENDGELHDTVMTPGREPRRLDVDDGHVTSSGCLRSHGSAPPVAPFCPAARFVPRPILHRRRGEIRRVSSRYAFLRSRIMRTGAETAPLPRYRPP